jgi:hypothetical protein
MKTENKIGDECKDGESWKVQGEGDDSLVGQEK